MSDQKRHRNNLWRQEMRFYTLCMLIFDWNKDSMGTKLSCCEY